MTRRRWWLLALAVACVGWVLGGEWVSIRHGVPENHFIDALGGLAFLAGGIIALDRRPGNAIGPLMIAFGMVGYFGNWGNIDVPILPLLGTSLGQWAGTPILAQIALSYPTGRLRTTFDRVVIGLAYAVAISINVVILLVFDPRSAGCAGCAWEPAPFPSRAALIAATSMYQRAGAVLALLFFAAVWLRFRRATAAERRDLAPLWLAACVIALMYLLGAFDSPFPLADPFSYLMWELQSVLQISLPVADAVRRIARGGSAIDPTWWRSCCAGEIAASWRTSPAASRTSWPFSPRAARTTPSASGYSSRRRLSRPTSGPSSPSWACCPRPTTTGASSRCSCTSGTHEHRTGYAGALGSPARTAAPFRSAPGG